MLVHAARRLDYSAGRVLRRGPFSFFRHSFSSDRRNDMARHEIAMKKLVYEMPGADGVAVRRDVPYQRTGDGPLLMDIYYPPQSAGAPWPAVAFAIGYSDRGAVEKLGCRFMDMESFAGWARLVAMSGAVAVTYSTGADPAGDLPVLLRHLRADASSIGIDPDRIGIWACSGHGPTAASALMRGPIVRAACAVLCYPYLLDLDGTPAVVDSAKLFNFAVPSGCGADDLDTEVPVFLARAGLDQMPGLNGALDRFVSAALARNLPLTLVNHATGPHAFDLFDDSHATRVVIRQALAFMQQQLRVQT